MGGVPQERHAVAGNDNTSHRQGHTTMTSSGRKSRGGCLRLRSWVVPQATAGHLEPCQIRHADFHMTNLDG